VVELTHGEKGHAYGAVRLDKEELMEGIDWRRVVSELLGRLLVTEKEFAKLCGVSRQSVSNWKRGSRSPGIYSRKKMFEIMENLKVDVDELSASEKVSKTRGRDVKTLVEIYGRLPEPRKKELLNFARYTIESLKKNRVSLEVWTFLAGLAALL